MQKFNLIMEKAADYNLNYRADSPSDIANLCRQVFKLDQQSEEVLVLICVSTAGEVIAVSEVFRGTLNTSAVSPRELFKRIILANSYSFVIAHNHPSGNLTPSPDDNIFTQAIKESAKILGIKFLDHLIVGADAYYSFGSNNDL